MLQDVKDVLKITWDDEDTTLAGIIERGENYLKGLTGTKLDFTVNNEAKSLLLNYCRYSYNSAGEYFEENFYKEITRLQLQEAVKENATEEG